ncbi:MAG: type II toxin-antitoxin system VapC family toxin [Ignavibacteriae bacterium]|jgi:tRNA(fMet)-specific endonuclease VapC|nr:type II toxin-antitoxin system VapC family toxin [Ignavibacteriota bacterium]
MKKILLDTSAYSQLMRGNKNVADYANEADIVYLSVFVIAELLTGFKGGSLEKRNLEILNNFKDKPAVQIIEATEETAEIFAEIKYKLKSAGTPIPINDLWIASNCFETGSVLITADKHFSLIQGLRISNILN